MFLSRLFIRKCTVCIVYIIINVAPAQVWIAVFLSCLFIRKCTVCIVYIINVAPPKFGLQCFFLVCLLENVRFVLYILLMWPRLSLDCGVSFLFGIRK